MTKWFHKRSFPALFFILIFFGINQLRSQTQWVKQFGGSDGDIGVSTCTDLFGNIYTTGTFTGTSTFGTYNLTSLGKGDAFIMKASASTGEVEWVKQIGSTNEDNGNALICDPSGNIYATGRFSGTIALGSFTLTASGAYDSFLLRVDPSTGAFIWAKRMGGPGSDGGLAITSDLAGSIYSCGYFQGTATFGTSTISPLGPNLNMYLLRIDGSSGNTVWAQGFGNAGYTYAVALCCDLVGDVYITGSFESELVMGTNTLSSVQYEDAFVSKHDALTGTVVWATSMGGNGSDSGNGIVVNSVGEVFCAGKFEDLVTFGTTTLTSAGSSDIFISKLDGSTGTLSMVKQFGAGGYEQASAIALDANGKIYITGQFNGIVNFGNFSLSSNGNSDVFIVKMDPVSGGVTWASGMGGQAVDSGYGVTIDSNGFLYCTGTFQSSANLLDNILITKGSSDIFIVKLVGITVGLSRDQFFQKTFDLAPNPCNKEIGINIKTEAETVYTITVLDITGKSIRSVSTSEKNILWDTSNLDPGIYFITFETKNERPLVKKIIKE